MRSLWLLAVLALAAGCGSGPDDNRARTDAEKVDDQAIAAEVNRVLSRVAGVDRLKLRIEVSRGHVALSGPVRDDEAARAACDAARKVDGVVDVADRLAREK